MHDAEGRFRIELPGHPPEFGWAKPAETPPFDGGYTVEWDIGEADYPGTRWYFEGTGIFDIKAV